MADNGIEGLEILHETQVDLVIANANMRLITGLRILNFLKREERFRKIFVILVADESDSETLKAIQKSAADGTLTLPLNEEKIISVVTDVLSNK